MDEFESAITTAIVYFIGAIFYIFIMIPLGLLCILASIVLLPLDFLVLLISFGRAEFDIFKGFQKAGSLCFQWFAETIASRYW
jgi:hypothetical protein